MVTIRTANTQDIEVVLELSRIAFTETFALLHSEAVLNEYLSENFSLEKIQEEFEAPETIFLLAYVNEEISGYAKYRYASNPALTGFQKQAELEVLFVLQNYRGKRVGKSLLEVCMILTVQAGAEVLWLYMQEHHKKALGFYQKLGFNQFGQTHFKPGSASQSAYLLKLEVNEMA